MVRELVNAFTIFLMQYFPYMVAIKIKDSITMVAGFFIGILFSLFWLSYVVKNANIEWKKFEDRDMLLAVSFLKGSEVVTYLNPPSSFSDWFNVLLALSFIRRRKTDTVTLKDIRKLRIIMLTLAIILIFLTVLGIMFILTPELPSGTPTIPHPNLE